MFANSYSQLRPVSSYQTHVPVVHNESFTIEPILLETTFFASTEDSSMLQPQQMMLLFDDHTYDDERIIGIHREIEKRFGIRGQT